MSSMTDHSMKEGLLALAERCEKATGPDRLLDAAIHCALTGRDFPEPPYTQTLELDRFKPSLGTFEQSTKAGLLLQAYKDAGQHYTASVDAALTLVPENHAFNLDNGPCHWICLGKQKPMGRVDLKYPRPDYGGEGDSWLTVSAIAATPALALCAAALRARASGGNQ